MFKQRKQQTDVELADISLNLETQNSLKVLRKSQHERANIKHMLVVNVLHFYDTFVFNKLVDVQ